MRAVAIVLLMGVSFVNPAAVFAQAVDAQGNPTGPQGPVGPQAPVGPQEPTGTSCSGVGCPVEEANVEVENSNTGEGSTNENEVDTTNSTNTAIDNAVTDNTTASATGSTGGNTQNANTAASGVTTGDASIGVTQVKNDNTATVGGTAGLSTSGHAGDHEGDLTLGFGSSTANLGSGGSSSSVRAINETTGNDSTNSNEVTTRTEELTEVQNDGQINNLLDLAAVTGRNQTNQNTGDGSIATGDASVAATLVNLLNTTVINGDIWITVADIFGDLNGDILVSDLGTLAAAARAQQTIIDAQNGTTGNDSTNSIDVTLRDDEATTINNDADITTTINADAITGQNDALANTGGAAIATGDARVVGSNVSVANTTVEGGNWGLFIVNALNGWMGFLVGDNGQVQALSQEETIRQIEANNQNTGQDSDNTIAITDENNRETTVDNTAVINNEINAQAITGQNEANENTGQGRIQTGNASVQATAVNIANTTVKDGSLFIAVVNIFGDWMGDLFYDGTSLAQQAATQQAAGHQVDINAGNTETGSGSENEVNVDIDRSQETTINNDADLTFALNANVDTGNNRANRNTKGALIETGEGFLAQHSRTAANISALAGAGGLSVDITGTNGETGFDSRNTIRADINDTRVITVNNEADVSTLLGSAGSPALVNTGDNEANENTLGVTINTGNIDADVAVQNLVNRVIVALTGEGVEVDATFVNTLTGALSDNDNNLTVLRDTLATVTNDAVIDTILNLLLNTGRNTANGNTGGPLTSTGAAGFGPAALGGGPAITTGSICFNGVVQHDVNEVTISAGVSQDVTNNATVNNQANIDAITGSNQLHNNTNVGGPNGDPDPCGKLAVAPTPTPGPTGPGDGGQGGDGDQGGDGESGQGGGDEDDDEPAVAGTTDEKPRQPRIAGVNTILKRFPVAGGESIAQWLPGQQRFPWLSFALLGLGIVSFAYYFDRKARLRKIQVPLSVAAA